MNNVNRPHKLFPQPRRCPIQQVQSPTGGTQKGKSLAKYASSAWKEFTKGSSKGQILPHVKFRGSTAAWPVSCSLHSPRSGLFVHCIPFVAPAAVTSVKRKGTVRAERQGPSHLSRWKPGPHCMRFVHRIRSRNLAKSTACVSFGTSMLLPKVFTTFIRYARTSLSCSAFITM